MEDIIKELDAFRVRVVTLAYADNPREDHDHVAHVIRSGRDAGIVSKNDDGGPLMDAWEHLARTYDHDDAVMIFTKYLRAYHGGVIVTDPPGISGRSLWYVTGEDIELARWRPENVEQYLCEEAEEFAGWANGAIYRVYLDRVVLDTNGTPTEEWEEGLEESGNWFGYRYAERDAERMLSEAAETHGPPVIPPAARRILTPGEILAERLCVALENDEGTAEEIRAYVADVLHRDEPNAWHNIGAWVRELITDQYNEAPEMGDAVTLFWGEAVSFLAWDYVGEYFGRRYEA